MVIEKTAMAGTLESGDAQVTVEPGEVMEDAVAENQKDAARFSLYHALKSIDYRNTEVIVRINGLDTPHWQEDIRVCVAGGADGIRIAKCENAAMVRQVDEAMTAAEKEFGVEVGRTMLMAGRGTPAMEEAYRMGKAIG